MKYVALLFMMPFLLFGCSDSAGKSGDAKKGSKTEKKADDGKGVGEIKHVDLANPLDQEMVSRGKTIYDLKCAACHRLSDQRVVGPGWKDVTNKRKPEWIMNMITNVDIMLAEDATAQALLNQCLVRMPNQNVSLEDARDILEFMRSNDGEQ